MTILLSLTVLALVAGWYAHAKVKSREISKYHNYCDELFEQLYDAREVIFRETGRPASHFLSKESEKSSGN